MAGNSEFDQALKIKNINSYIRGFLTLRNGADSTMITKILVMIKGYLLNSHCWTHRTNHL